MTPAHPFVHPLPSNFCLTRYFLIDTSALAASGPSVSLGFAGASLRQVRLQWSAKMGMVSDGLIDSVSAMRCAIDARDSS